MSQSCWSAKLGPPQPTLDRQSPRAIEQKVTAPDHVVAAWLGHSNISTTSRYLRASRADLQQQLTSNLVNRLAAKELQVYNLCCALMVATKCFECAVNILLLQLMRPRGVP